MKKTVIALAYLLSCTSIFSQNVGINAINSTPNASAGLDIDFTNKGLLIPRVALTSTTDATTITSAATSLLVYNTATISDVFPGYYYWDGTKWVRMINTGNSSGGDWSLTGNAGTTVGTNFLGTTDAQDFAIYTNNTEKIRVVQNGNVGIGTILPAAKLEVFNGDVKITRNNNIGAFNSQVFSSASPVGPHFYGLRGRGSNTSPSYPMIGDLLAAFQGRPYTGTSSAGMQVWAAENQSAVAQGSFLEFTTVPVGSTVSTFRMRILANGNVGIGTITPGEQLTIGVNNFVFHNGGDKAIGFNTDWTVANQWTKIAGSNYQGRIHFNPTTGDLGFISSSVATGLNNLVDNKIFIQGGTGNIGIGTTTPTQRLVVQGTTQIIHDSPTSTGLIFTDATSPVDAGASIGVLGAGLALSSNISIATPLMYLGNGVGINTINATATLSVNGAANKPGGGAWAVFSDRRLKKEIQPYSSGLDILSKINIVSYQYNDEYFKTFGESKEVRNTIYQGVIAQELQKIVPYMVQEKHPEVYDENGEAVETKSVLEVDPSAFTYMLINAVKELKAENDTLKNQLLEIKKLLQTK